MADALPELHKELSKIAGKARLTSAVDAIDKIIAQLTAAREQVASASDPHTASLTMTKLQNPVREGFEAVNDALKLVSKTQKEFGKSLDKSFPVKALPTDHDAMADYPALIDRAIAMHLLREGQFSVASTFMDEAEDMNRGQSQAHAHSKSPSADLGDDTAMQGTEDGEEEEGEAHEEVESQGRSQRGGGETASFTTVQSRELQAQFERMYAILRAIKAYDLSQAIEWSRQKSAELEERGSNLEFELCKLQYIWLFKNALSSSPLPTNDDQTIPPSAQPYRTPNLAAAHAYARENFARFRARHLREIQQLASAMVFAPNVADSPYAALFETDAAFEEVADSFTREFCLLLGLSAVSPLYVAATAGAVALPRLVKFVGATRGHKGAAWTSANELAFETPLPASMVYHSIFVCPVSKEQTTDANPPMMLPCGHVLARESLQNLAKGPRFKCPYCPSEGTLSQARQIIL